MEKKDLPLVSIVVLTYNQEQYIEAALEGVASQDYPNLEIIVSDDNSNDNTKKVIENFRLKYKGSQKIIYNYNNENLGLVRHFNKIMSMVTGDYVVLAAGDDISLKNRTTLSVREIRKAGVDSLALNFKYIDGKGNDMNKCAFKLTNDIKIFKLSDYVLGKVPHPSGPSRIITKRVFDFFGPFQDDCPTEDSTLTFRALLLRGIAHYSEVGVNYRWHDNNMSSIDNIYRKIDPNKIYSQYYKDLCVAKEKNIIENSEYRLVKKKIDEYKITQVFRRNMYNEKNPWIRYLLILKYLFNVKVSYINKKKIISKE